MANNSRTQNQSGKTREKTILTEKTTKNSSKPPSTEFKENKTNSTNKSSRRKASIGRKGGGRKLNPHPDRTIVAQVKHCPHCQEKISKEEQKLTRTI